MLFFPLSQPFGSTYIHQTLQLYSYQHIEGFHRGVCLYVINNYIYIKFYY